MLYYYNTFCVIVNRYYEYIVVTAYPRIIREVDTTHRSSGNNSDAL